MTELDAGVLTQAIYFRQYQVAGTWAITLNDQLGGIRVVDAAGAEALLRALEILWFQFGVMHDVVLVKWPLWACSAGSPTLPVA